MSDDNNKLREYIEAETQQNLKSAKIGIIMFTILVLVILIYFQILKSMLKEVVQPRELARTGVSLLESNIPDVVSGLESGIRDALPQVVKYTVDTVVDEAIPRMRKTAQGYLDQHSAALADFASQAGDEVFVKILSETRKDWQSRVPPQDAGGSDSGESMAASLEAAIQLNMKNRLTAKMNEEVDSRDPESAAVKLHQSAMALRNINARLNQLADNKGLNREQGLQRRIIGAWWGWMQKTNAGSGAAALPEQGDVAPAEGK